MSEKFKKGDVVYYEILDTLLVVERQEIYGYVTCRSQYNPLYIKPHELHLISSGGFINYDMMENGDVVYHADTDMLLIYNYSENDKASCKFADFFGMNCFVNKDGLTLISKGDFA